MKKFLTLTGAAAALVGSFVLAAIAIFLLSVVISLLMNEQEHIEEELSEQLKEQEPEYLDAYNILDDERGVVAWSDPKKGESGNVLYIANGSSFQFFGRLGDDIHNNRQVMNEMTEIMSEKVMEQ